MIVLSIYPAGAVLKSSLWAGGAIQDGALLNLPAYLYEPGPPVPPPITCEACGDSRPWWSTICCICDARQQRAKQEADRAERDAVVGQP